MSHPEPLSGWTLTVSTLLPKLSRPQAKVLASWSYGTHELRNEVIEELIPE